MRFNSQFVKRALRNAEKRDFRAMGARSGKIAELNVTPAPGGGAPGLPAQLGIKLPLSAGAR